MTVGARVVVFDAYGTLFDVGAAARALAATRPEGDAFAARWRELAETWRRKQLEYTWLRAITGRHADFRRVTADALEVALGLEGLDTLPDRGALTARLLALYDRLEAYPDAWPALEALRADGRPATILSNGSPEMLASAVGAAGLDGLFAAVLSVEAVGVFKPHPSVYALVEQRFGVAPREALFVSSNGWDVCSAAAYGFRTVWVNRRGDPADRLDAAPTHVVRDLAGTPAIAREGTTTP